VDRAPSFVACCLAACSPAASPKFAATTAGDVRALPHHERDVVLWNDGDLWASMIVRDDLECANEPTARWCRGDWKRLVRISRGTGPATVEVGVDRVIGVRESVVYAVRHGALVAIDAAGRITPRGPAIADARFAIAATGELVAAVGRTVSVGERRFENVVAEGESIIGLASAPHSPRLALALTSPQRSHFVEIDPATGQTIVDREVARFGDGDGFITYDDGGDLWLRHGQIEHWHQGMLAGRISNVAAPVFQISGDGAAIAYDREIEGSELARGTWCEIYFHRVDETRPQPVFTQASRCELAFRIVGRTLWIAR
jgi:hypothetical protein